jgi:phosphoglycolate phosphatase-like HAD superfamily hydrolase
MTLGGSGDTEINSGGDPPEVSRSELKTGWAGAANASTAPEAHIYIQPGFNWIAPDAYLFDIDGTLLNSRDAVHYHAFHRAVQQVFGLDFRVDGVPVHGNTDVGILRAYLEVANIPESHWRPRLPEVLELMSADVERNCSALRPQVCPAVIEVIALLSRHDKLLGIASGNLERVGWAKLRACGLRDRFSFGAFSGQLEKRDDVIAHGIRQARMVRGQDTSVCVVGDTPADIRSAHANKIPAIAVATGIYSFAELLAHGPELCVSCCEDLLRDPIEVDR